MISLCNQIPFRPELNIPKTNLNINTTSTAPLITNYNLISTSEADIPQNTLPIQSQSSTKPIATKYPFNTLTTPPLQIQQGTVPLIPPKFLTGLVDGRFVGTTVEDWVREIQRLFLLNPEWDESRKLKIARERINREGTAWLIANRPYMNWNDLKKDLARLLGGVTMSVYDITLALSVTRWKIEIENFESYANKFISVIDKIQRNEIHYVPDLWYAAKWQFLYNIPSGIFVEEFIKRNNRDIVSACINVSDFRYFVRIIEIVMQISHSPIIKWYLLHKDTLYVNQE